jgi:hypothetical protein
MGKLKEFKTHWGLLGKHSLRVKGVDSGMRQVGLECGIYANKVFQSRLF